MVAFANERASGAVCADRRASLDDFIRATAGLAEDGTRVALGAATLAEHNYRPRDARTVGAAANLR
jgi:hypothetical protein